jgi:hypothetical protein
MCEVVGALILGAVAGTAAGTAAAKPARLRPAVREVVKRGLMAKRKIESASAAVTAEARKLVEEARLELDQAETEQHS